MSRCEEEPCKSTLDNYWRAVQEGREAERRVWFNCFALNAVREQARAIFALWLALLAMAIVCMAFHLIPVYCQYLWYLVLIALGVFFIWLSRFIWLSERLKRNKRDCVNMNFKIAMRWSDAREACPEECWPRLVELKCACD